MPAVRQPSLAIAEYDLDWYHRVNQGGFGRTHGLLIDAAGQLVVLHMQSPGSDQSASAPPAVAVIDSEGTTVATWGHDYAWGAHGLTATTWHGQAAAWVCDKERGEVALVTLDGQVRDRLAPPPHPAYASQAYRPTQLALGPDGTRYVVDGYGASLLHAYDATNHYRWTRDGSGSHPGRFDCPHGCWLDDRTGVPRLAVADRVHRRIQYLDLDGQPLGLLEHPALRYPSAAAVVDNHLVVVDLYGCLSVWDHHDTLVGFIGDDPDLPLDDTGRPTVAGWPNLDRASHRPQRFIAPHAVVVDDAGWWYVAEWLDGGRLHRFKPDWVA